MKWLIVLICWYKIELLLGNGNEFFFVRNVKSYSNIVLCICKLMFKVLFRGYIRFDVSKFNVGGGCVDIIKIKIVIWYCYIFVVDFDEGFF